LDHLHLKDSGELHIMVDSLQAFPLV